jgi:hypothetical protein
MEGIDHAMAAALKCQFGKTGEDKAFNSLASEGGKNLRQTAHAFLNSVSA